MYITGLLNLQIIKLIKPNYLLWNIFDLIFTKNMKIDDDHQIDDELIDRASNKQSLSHIEDMEERKAIYGL